MTTPPLALGSALALVMLLSACGDGQPFQFGGEGTVDPEEPTETESSGVLSEIADNLHAIQYDADGQTLRVDMTALDRTNADYPLVAYYRNPGLDIPGYEAYIYQDDPLDRMFLAMAAESGNGVVTGAVVADGGQFTHYFPGAFYGRNGPFSASSSTGLVSYAGNYTGILNSGTHGPELLPVPGGIDPSLLPTQAIQTWGLVFINADFGDNSLNGMIYDRIAVDSEVPHPTGTTPTAAATFPNVILVPTKIGADGLFNGTTEWMDDEGNRQSTGVYGGIFGGEGATGLAGAIRIANFFENGSDAVEYGIFVLVQCGQPGDEPICDSVNH